MWLPTENAQDSLRQERQQSIRSRRRLRTRLISVASPEYQRKSSLSRSLLLLALFLLSDGFSWRESLRCGHRVAHAFVTERPSLSVSSSSSPGSFSPRIDPTMDRHRRKNPALEPKTPSTKIFLAPEIPTEAATGLANYAPAATTLFNNMKLPAAVVTAGMISLGFATTFPELPKKSQTTGKPYSDELRARCESLKRLHIVVSLIAVTSELVVVLWAAVEVNQLTEKKYELAHSVWDLIQRDCDLAWSAVNSHFVLGILGFVTMLSLRAYVQLLAVEASAALMTAASTGTGAALCLLISIVNRGVESGGGEGQRYGSTIFDLFSHYAVLLSEAATSGVSPGPLQFMAIVLELVSLTYMANVLLFQNGKMKYEEVEGITLNETNGEAEECPVIDIVEVSASSSVENQDGTDTKKKVRVVIDSRDVNGNSGELFFATPNTDGSRANVARCLGIEEAQQADDEEELRSNDTSVNVY
mmetsp:Transcript_18158/g.45132  ORF Transcript_18158/g.45132 Transcript_18158/m.45132 type:complete len:473 (-) Transcript_18158:145-1563(-)